eukprot:12694212-Ditylum_brightwellii.AAC.1
MIYPGEVHTPTADMNVAKILFNGIISAKNARFCTIDTKIFYLNTPMARYEYMKIPLNLIPGKIIQQYEFKNIEINGHVYVDRRKGMCGLPQASRIAHDQLKQHLAKHGYKPVKHTPGL